MDENMYFDIEENVLVEVRGDEACIVIPDGVAVIKKCVFRRSAMKEVRFPESLRAIERAAFSGCIELASVWIPDGVERIAAFAFSACEALRDVVLPASLKRIRAGCFSRDYALQSISIPDVVTQVGTRLSPTASRCAALCCPRPLR